MKKYLRCFLIAVVSLFDFYTAAASHLAGSDFTYIFVDSSAGIYHYRVTLCIYDDCLNGNPESILYDNPAFMAVYTGTDSLVEADSNIYYSSSVVLPVSVNGSCGADSSIPALCRKKLTFIKDYYLPASATGYTVVYQRCCLDFVTNITESFNQGITAACTIPQSSVTTHNNSAVFTNYPPFILIPNTPLVFNCSATDADGDSLSYELCNAYNFPIPDSLGANDKPFPPAPPPYTHYSYITPLSYSDPVTCSVPLALNPVTGILTCTPDSTGLYIAAVCCSEWRHGVLINTVQRIFQFAVAGCTTGIPATSKGTQLALYPNPATTQLTISAPDNITSITISNIMGQTMYSQQYNTQTIQVDISELPKGLYFVKVNGTDIRKFVKAD